MNIDSLVKDIQKKYGKEILLDYEESKNIKFVSTGSYLLDEAVSGKGFPCGRIIEIFGNEGSGKTSIAISAASAFQKQGGNIVYIDCENSFNIEWSQKFGLTDENFLLVHPEYAEQALDIVIRACQVPDSMVVLDSTASLVPKGEIQTDLEEATIATVARLMSKALSRIVTIQHPTTIVLFIDQIRSKIGVMFGNPNVPTGGNALKFYSSVRIEAHRADLITQSEKVIGMNINVKVVKNKVAPPFKKATIPLYFDRGFDREAELIDIAIVHGIIEKKGSWFSYKGENIAQGKQKLIEYVRNNKEILEEIETCR